MSKKKDWSARTWTIMGKPETRKDKETIRFIVLFEFERSQISEQCLMTIQDNEAPLNPFPSSETRSGGDNKAITYVTLEGLV